MMHFVSKGLIISILGLGSLTSCSEKTIERPAFSVRNSTILEIDKIVFNDSATVVYFDTYYQYYQGIRIDTTARLVAENTVYPVSEARGLNLNEVCWMPESGDKSFSLIFPAMNPRPESLDFIESNDFNDFGIYGIEIKKGVNSHIKKQIPEHIRKSNFADSLAPEPKLTRGECNLKVHLVGYREGLVKNNLSCFRKCFWNRKMIEFEVPVDSTGIVDFSFHCEAPELIGLFDDRDYGTVYIYIEGGTDLEVWLDLEEMSHRKARYHNPSANENPMLYSEGRLSAFNESINRDNNSSPAFKLMEWNSFFYRKVINMTGDDYLDYITSRFYAVKEHIEQFPGLTKLDKELYYLTLTSQYMYCIVMAEDLIMEAYKVVYDLDKDEVRHKCIRITEEQKREALKLVDLNNPKLIYTNDFTFRLLDCYAKHPNLFEGIDHPFLTDMIKGVPIFMKSVFAKEPVSEEELIVLQSLKDPFYRESVEIAARRKAPVIPDAVGRVAIAR